MKKINRKIISILTLVMMLMIPVMNVSAANISKLSTEVEDKKLTVYGTAEDGVVAAAILVYDEAGTNLLQMETVSVSDDHKFTNTFSIPNGTYTVKVADYDGGEFLSEKVTVKSVGVSIKDVDTNKTADGEEKKSPKTSDTSMMIYIVLIAGLSICGITSYRRREA